MSRNKVQLVFPVWCSQLGNLCSTVYNVQMRWSAVYFGYAHSQSQAVILQVLSVGGGVVGERGVGDELRPATRLSILMLTSNSMKAMI